VPEQPGFSYQWYKDGVALIGETSWQLNNMHGEGNYQVRVQQGGSCSLTGIYTYTIPVTSAQVSMTICEGDIYPFGDRLLGESGTYVDTFKTIQHCDSIVTLDLHITETLADTVIVKIFEGETYNIDQYRFDREGEYLAHLHTSQGCDSLLFLQLQYYHIFIPNVFSPNGDGINDLFSIVGAGSEIQKEHLVIFDRWGSQIFSGSQWDGNSKGVIAIPGVVTYVATLTMNDGVERQFSGSLTIVR
jgi:gliding motility-associated-like protein